MTASLRCDDGLAIDTTEDRKIVRIGVKMTKEDANR